jgi:thiamine-phosphate pyrophosphorylase
VSGSRVPLLHVVTTAESLERPGFVAAARALLRVGDLALHVRAPAVGGRGLLEIVRAVLAGGSLTGGATLLVNDRVDVARIAGTGAHLPEAGLTPAQARTILGPDPLLGRSIHDPAEAASVNAGRRTLDYVFFGHVFETASKPGLPGRGFGELAEAARSGTAVGLPVLAIGGMTPERVAPALEAGAHGVAAVAGIWDAPDPPLAARTYLMALGAAARARPGLDPGS